MSNKRIVARNALWSWAGVATAMVTGFVVSPFLVKTLGDGGYGLWLLIASLTGYFGLLDLGMRGSVGRNIAFYRGKNDQENVNVMLSTSLMILGIASLIAIFVTFTFLSQFLYLFKVPPDQLNDARIALIYVGINFSLMLPFQVFDATLWGFQRFDILNSIDIAGAVLRLWLTFYLLKMGHGIVALAQITLFTSLSVYLLKGIAIFCVDRQLRVGLRYVTREGAQKLFGYGVWTFVLSISRLLTSQLSTLIVAARFSLELVTPYGIASRLVSYGVQLVSTGTAVLTPYSAALHGGGKEDTQKQLFLYGGRFCLALTLFFTYNFLFLGGSLIQLWQGPSQAGAIPILYALILGETFAASQLVSHAIILGMGRPRVLATLNIFDAVVVVLTTLFVSRYGLFWVCVGFAVSATLIRGIATFLCVSSAVGVSVMSYLSVTVLPVLAATSIPALLLALTVAWRTPANWTELFLYGGCFTIVYASGCLFLVGTEQLRGVFARVRRTFQSGNSG